MESQQWPQSGHMNPSNPSNQTRQCETNSKWTVTILSGELHFFLLLLLTQCHGLMHCSDFFYSVRLKEGRRHGERGEYELRNGKPVFIIRGYFGHITPTVILRDSITQFIHTLIANVNNWFFLRYTQGDFQITAYVFDHTGYHEIPVENGVADFRPEISDSECDLSTGNYCIDQKLLTLMVG